MDYGLLYTRMVSEIADATGLVVCEDLTWTELVELHDAAID